MLLRRVIHLWCPHENEGFWPPPLSTCFHMKLTPRPIWKSTCERPWTCRAVFRQRKDVGSCVCYPWLVLGVGNEEEEGRHKGWTKVIQKTTGTDASSAAERNNHKSQIETGAVSRLSVVSCTRSPDEILFWNCHASFLSCHAMMVIGVIKII